MEQSISSLTLAETKPTGSTKNDQVQLTDSPTGIKDLLTLLTTPITPQPTLYIDLEGINLSRHGPIFLIQIWQTPLNRAFIIDVHTLGAQAFEVANDKGTTLRSVLEDKTVRKYLFDCRNDSDALFAHYGVKLAGVTDLQLLELATRQPGRRSRVSGLAHYVEEVLLRRQASSPSPAAAAEVEDFKITKSAVHRLFDPRFGSSCEVFNVRPLPRVLVEYAVGDVRYLPLLAAAFEEKLNRVWMKRAGVESGRRLRQSWGLAMRRIVLTRVWARGVGGSCLRVGVSRLLVWG